QLPAFRFKVPGFRVQGSRFKVQVPAKSKPNLRVTLVAGSWEPGTRNQEPSWKLEAGSWQLATGTDSVPHHPHRHASRAIAQEDVERGGRAVVVEQVGRDVV